MRIVTYEEPYYQKERVGLMLNKDGASTIVDASSAYSVMLEKEFKESYAEKIANSDLPSDLVEILCRGEKAMKRLRETEQFILKNEISPKSQRTDGKRIAFESSEVKIKAPIPRPGKIIHTAGNFREHAKEGSDSGWEFPMPHWISFLKSPSAIIGHEGNVIHPKYTKQLDHEIELAIVIGKKSKRLTKENAWDAIAGFTIFNDITARDIQREEMKSGLLNFGKNMDTFAPFGPCFVPKEDVGDVHNLKIECRVNGDPRQVSNTNHLSVSVPEIIEHYSWVTLYPGDIVTTGTVSGVAAFRNDAEKYFLKPGVLLESEIENIGILRNHIVEDSEAY